MSQGLFFGHVTADGILKLDQEPAYRAFAKRKFSGKAIEVCLRAKRSKRSLKANATYWGFVIRALADELGYDKHEHEMLHWALLGKFFGTHRDKLSGLEVPNKTSSGLSMKEFSEFMDWAVRFAATEYGVVVEMPDDLHLSNS